MDNIKSLFMFVLIFQFGASANAQKNYGLSFRFFACKEIREKNLLKSILIIDSVKKDTVNAGSLLVGDSIILSYDNQYSFLLVGTGKWDYFVKNEIVRNDFPAKLTICYNAHQKKSDENVL